MYYTVILSPTEFKQITSVLKQSMTLAVLVFVYV